MNVTLCFFFNDTATTEIYTLSLHDALPIWTHRTRASDENRVPGRSVAVTEREGTAVLSDSPAFSGFSVDDLDKARRFYRSEEHTSELQSRQYLVCRLLLEKKKKNNYYLYHC